MKQGLEQATYYMIKKSVDVLRNISLKRGKKSPNFWDVSLRICHNLARLFKKKFLCEICTFSIFLFHFHHMEYVLSPALFIYFQFIFFIGMIACNKIVTCWIVNHHQSLLAESTVLVLNK